MRFAPLEYCKILRTRIQGYFRCHELAEFTEQSDTTRSPLNRMEKLGLISQSELWLAMRNIWNRIVHDYLPEQSAKMLGEISKVYVPELLGLRDR